MYENNETAKVAKSNLIFPADLADWRRKDQRESARSAGE